jgi:hypothetical protein
LKNLKENCSKIIINIRKLVFIFPIKKHRTVKSKKEIKKFNKLK